MKRFPTEAEKKAAMETGRRSHRIAFAARDESFACGGGDTILRAALRAGYGFPYECNSGSCGTCKFELVAGEVEAGWPDAPGLTERDRERGKRLGCQSRPLTDCVVRVRLDPAYALRVRPRVRSATLAEVRDLTPDMREFRFRAEDPADFLPGQYALLTLPGVESSRAYSMCNLANDSGEWHFHVKRVPNGMVTGVLFDRLAVGGRVDIDGPYGIAFLRPDRPRDVVCIAGGSGLSPMISIARAFARAPELAGRRLAFFYGGRGPRDICGEDLLAELPGYGDRIRFLPVISMPELDVENAWTGRPTGFVHEHVERSLAPDLAAYEYYMAGPPPMVEAALKMLVLRRKVPVGQVHYDRFF